MSFGVTFLNPVYKEDANHTQHKALSRIGFPYSYVVDLDNVTNVVHAAEQSYKYRFSSYVPPSYRVESVVNRMRSLLEDDSFCSLPRVTYTNGARAKS